MSLHDLLKSFCSSFLHKITIKVIEIMLLDKPAILLFPWALVKKSFKGGSKKPWSDTF